MSRLLELIAALPRAEVRFAAWILVIFVAPFLIYRLLRPERFVSRLPDWHGAPLFPSLKRTIVVRLLCCVGLAMTTFFIVSAFTCRTALC